MYVLLYDGDDDEEDDFRDPPRDSGVVSFEPIHPRTPTHHVCAIEAHSDREEGVAVHLGPLWEKGV